MSVPTTALLLVSYTLTPLYANRYLLYTAPGMALLLGGALASLRPQWKRITVGVLLCALCFPGLLASRFPYAHDGTDWKTAAEILKARAASGDVILFFPDVGNTADPRRALDGYPDLLGDLDDAGLSRTAEQRNSLEGTGVSPKDWKQRIPAGARLWLLARRTTTRAEYRQITRQGFRLQKIWAGPSTVVYRVRLTGHTS
jgi:mannosyltransferase